MKLIKWINSCKIFYWIRIALCLWIYMTEPVENPAERQRRNWQFVKERFNSPDWSGVRTPFREELRQVCKKEVWVPMWPPINHMWALRTLWCDVRETTCMCCQDIMWALLCLSPRTLHLSIHWPKREPLCCSLCAGDMLYLTVGSR